MKLVRLRSEGFRGLPDRVFDFAHVGTGEPFDHVFITGNPSSGKTSLLEAIIAAKEDIGAYGARRPSSAHLRLGAPSALLEATWLLSPGETHRAQLPSPRVTTTTILGEGEPPLPPHADGLRAFFREYTRDANRGKVAYFHAERTLPPGRGMRHTPSEASAVDARSCLTTSTEKYRALRSFLIDRVLDSTTALARELRERGVALRASQTDAVAHFRELLRPFLQDKVFDGIDPDGNGYRVRFRTPSGEVLDLDDLSASERQGVLFATTFERSGLHHSIVLIDTPELHLHPNHHSDVVAALTGRGRDNQIIAATTSVALLSAAQPAQVIDLSHTRA
jgi:predicted ATPase